MSGHRLHTWSFGLAFLPHLSCFFLYQLLTIPPPLCFYLSDPHPSFDWCQKKKNWLDVAFFVSRLLLKAKKLLH